MTSKFESCEAYQENMLSLHCRFVDIPDAIMTVTGVKS